MTPERSQQVLRSLILAAILSLVVSIAVAQILMGAAILAMLYFRVRFTFPPIERPALLFLGLTIVSLLASGDPAAGWPYIKKFYVWIILALVYTCFRTAPQLRPVVLGLAAITGLSSLVSLVQLGLKYRAAAAAKSGNQAGNQAGNRQGGKEQ